MITLPKLIRDKIPGIIRDSGRELQAHVADSAEFDILLIEKMREELSEFSEAPCLDEAADIYEVFLALLKNWKMSLVDVKRVAEIKRELRGSFSAGIVLDKVFDDDGV
jgi:predicted house-cleaning noncanonical NTP pyrophosphatase (MazG superfamily)